MNLQKQIRTLAAIALTGAILLLTGCGAAAGTASSTAAASSAAASPAGKTYKVAFVQLVDNSAFDEMKTAFTDKMRALGYDEASMTFETLNAQGDASTLNTIASELKSGGYDLIVPIVTPATQAVVNQELDTPVVFISVTDPVGSGILSSLEAPDKNATGTSNLVPVDKIFGLAATLTPEAKHIGILYCSGEKNAVQTAEKAKAYLESAGYTYEEVTVANSSEVQQAAQSLAGKVDAIYVPIDSTVQSAMPQVVEAATAAGIPVYGSDPVMVKSGALACVSVSNTQLGARSAEMADAILKGTPVSEVPAEAMREYQYVVSKSAADALGISLPSDGSVTVIGG